MTFLLQNVNTLFWYYSYTYTIKYAKFYIRIILVLRLFPGKRGMKTNFDFLKKDDRFLYEIMADAESLYRDEYFDQCMTQVRRFGENVCKNVLGARRTTETTFDDMLATLKDCTLGSSEEAKEFIDDLYFLKKYGNEATHSITVKKEGTDALECLKRAFEIAINYYVYTLGGSREILKLQYDTELMITGKKSKKTLAEKYNEQKAITTKKSSKSTAKKPQKQYCSVKSDSKQKRPYFWYFVGFTAIVSAIMMIILAVI